MKLSLILMTKKRFKFDYFQLIEQKKLFNSSIFTIIVLLKSSHQFMSRSFFLFCFHVASIYQPALFGMADIKKCVLEIL